MPMATASVVAGIWLAEFTTLPLRSMRFPVDGSRCRPVPADVPIATLLLPVVNMPAFTPFATFELPVVFSAA